MRFFAINLRILSLQLERVRSLLSETELNLSIIAERAGFNHVEYMSVAFKREFGVSPSVYRSENAGPTKPTPKGSEHP